MILSDLTIDNLLFEDEGYPTLGSRCAANIGPYQYVVGILHSYNSEEYCFKDCTYYLDKDKVIESWTTHPHKPIHWVSRNACIWAKSSKIESV